MEQVTKIFSWLRIPRTLESFPLTPELRKIRDWANKQNQKARESK